MKLLHTADAPAAIGPYSQAVALDGWLFTSGQIAIDPTHGNLIEGDFEAQAHQVMTNLRAILDNAGCSFEDVVKATVYVKNLADFPILNRIYGEALGDHRPARSTVEVAGLPRGALVEIDLIARIP